MEDHKNVINYFLGKILEIDLYYNYYKKNKENFGEISSGQLKDVINKFLEFLDKLGELKKYSTVNNEVFLNFLENFREIDIYKVLKEFVDGNITLNKLIEKLNNINEIFKQDYIHLVACLKLSGVIFGNSLIKNSSKKEIKNKIIELFQLKVENQKEFDRVIDEIYNIMKKNLVTH